MSNDAALPTRPAHRAWTFAWLGVAGGIAFALLTGAGSSVTGVWVTAFRIASSMLLIVALALWLVAAVRNPFWRPRTLLAPGFIASIAALLIALLGSSQPRLGLDYIAYAALLIGGYLFLQRLFAHPFFGPRLGALSVMVALITSLGYIAAVVMDWVYFWSQLGRLSVPMLRPYGEGIWWGNPGPLAAAIALLTIAAAVHLGLETAQARRATLGLVILGLVATFLAGARGGWVALAGASLAVAIALLLSSANRAAARGLSKQRTFRRAAVAGIAITMTIGLILAPAIGIRLVQPASDRFQYASVSIRMIADKPLTGIGPGMWVVDRIRYTDASELDEYTPHAHNLPFQTLAELGFVGAVAGVVVLAVLLRLVVRGANARDPAAQRLAWATVFGGVFLLIYQLTSSFIDAAGIWLCYALVVARLDALLMAEQRPTSGRIFAPVGVGMAVVLAGATMWLGYSERAALTNDIAVSAANTGDWDRARAAAEQAHEQDPSMPPYGFTLGIAEAHTGRPSEALAHIRASAEIDDFPVAWLDVARLELDLGNGEAGRTALDKAMRLGYQQPQVAFGASQMYIELGDRPAAVSALADALLVAPTMASDPWWAQTGQRPLLEDALSAALPEATPDVGYRLALEGSRPDVAAAIVASMPPDVRTIPDLVSRAWAGDAAAFDALHARSVDDPLDVATVLACLRVADRSRNDGVPGGDWTCDRAGTPGLVHPVYVRVVPARLVLTPLPGPADSTPYFLNFYRREGPFYRLVPGISELSVIPLP